jgi:hypothetical protein
VLRPEALMRGATVGETLEAVIGQLRVPTVSKVAN